MDAKDEIKSRLGIEDVIGEYVELKRAGRNFKGLSPFSSEKTPSLVVSPEKQIWHDFSSGRGGDMFSFVMEMEGLDFKTALSHLARKAGVDLEQFQGSGGSAARARHKERLYAVTELAVKFYQRQFAGSRTALEYALGKRQFSKQTALAWQLGYAPNTGSALCDFLGAKGFSGSEIKDAGLSAGNRYGNQSSNLRDMFRGRLMIPLHDPQGRPIGFTARLLDDDNSDGGGAQNFQAPKYINTPQTMLYDKSRHVYGLHLAKEAVRKQKYVVLVEGNLDVISSHQAGVAQVVATAGTAMTEQHLKALGKFTPDIRLAYDQDKAGLNAAERAIPIASQVGVSLSMVTIPSGKDPDELIKQDKAIWEQVITQQQYALDWLMQRYQGLLDVTTAQGKRRFSDVLLPIVRNLPDSVEQDHYLRQIAEIIGVSQEALTSKYQQATEIAAVARKRRKPNAPSPAQVDSRLAANIKTQDSLLALTLLQPALRPYLVQLTPDMLFTANGRDLLTFLQQNPGFDGTDQQHLNRLRPLADYCKIVSVAYEELYQDLNNVELQAEAARQRTRLIENYVKTQKSSIANQLETADEAATRTLLQQVIKLDQMLQAQM